MVWAEVTDGGAELSNWFVTPSRTVAELNELRWVSNRIRLEGAGMKVHNQHLHPDFRRVGEHGDLRRVGEHGGFGTQISVSKSSVVIRACLARALIGGR